MVFSPGDFGPFKLDCRRDFSGCLPNDFQVPGNRIHSFLITKESNPVHPLDIIQDSITLVFLSRRNNRQSRDMDHLPKNPVPNFRAKSLLRHKVHTPPGQILHFPLQVHKVGKIGGPIKSYEYIEITFRPVLVHGHGSKNPDITNTKSLRPGSPVSGKKIDKFVACHGPFHGKDIPHNR